MSTPSTHNTRFDFSSLFLKGMANAAILRWDGGSGAGLHSVHSQRGGGSRGVLAPAPNRAWHTAGTSSYSTLAGITGDGLTTSYSVSGALFRLQNKALPRRARTLLEAGAVPGKRARERGKVRLGQLPANYQRETGKSWLRKCHVAARWAEGPVEGLTHPQPRKDCDKHREEGRSPLARPQWAEKGGSRQDSQNPVLLTDCRDTDSGPALAQHVSVLPVSKPLACDSLTIPGSSLACVTEGPWCRSSGGLAELRQQGHQSSQTEEFLALCKIKFHHKKE